MRLLFLDTETSGLQFKDDQIIELAGVLADLDPVTLNVNVVSKFETLVGLRGDLDEKITRLTGINKQDLATAPSLFDAQKKWLEWLDLNSSSVTAIIGHSIDFDIGFLKNEKWYLPDEVKCVDTLNLSKILFPNLQALNLEYLVAQLSLSASENHSRAHRALYDTEMCLELFRALIKVLIDAPFPITLLDYICTHILPIGLKLYESKNFLKLSSSAQTEMKHKLQPTQESIVGVDGNVVEKSLLAVLNNLDFGFCQKELDHLLKTCTKEGLSLVLTQIYAIICWKKFRPDIDLQFHAQMGMGWNFAYLVCWYLFAQHPTQEAETKFILDFDKLISGIQPAVESKCELGKICYFLEILEIFLLNSVNYTQSKILPQIQQFLAAYDFFVLALLPFLATQEYKFVPAKANYHEKHLLIKWRSLIDEIEVLKALHHQDTFLQFVIEKITSELVDLPVSENQEYIFRLWKNNLIVSWLKPEFNLSTHFVKISKTYFNLVYKTRLTKDELYDFAKLLGLQNWLKQANIEYTQNLEFEISNLVISQGENKPEMLVNDEFLLNNLGVLPNLSQILSLSVENAKKPTLPCLILCGQNSSLKEISKMLVSSFDQSEYLLLGESGSLTKIVSKLSSGFNGVCVIKAGDFNFLQRSKSLKFSNVFVVNPVFFWMHSYWHNTSKQQPSPEMFLLSLKLFYHKSLLREISQSVKTPVHFIKSYIV